MENELQLYIKDVGDSIHDAIAEEFDKAYEEVETNKEYAPYGNTQVCVGEFIDEDSDCRIRERFEENMTFDEVIDLLKNDPYFKRNVMDLVKYIAENREG